MHVRSMVQVIHLRKVIVYIHLSAEKTNTYIFKVKIDIILIQYPEMRGNNGQILAKKPPT
jgi:hypothetical protein